MNISDYFKNFINKIKSKKQVKLLTKPQESSYAELISGPQIEAIINNMPQGLSEIEKAYYIYLELGKIISENPQFVFANKEEKERRYHDKIDTKYYGICKSISELYVDILKDKRIGISAETIKKYPESKISHVDTILNINGKSYIANLINDLSRIKTSRRVNSFCFDLNRTEKIPEIREDNQEYLKRLENRYGKIYSLTRPEIEKLDKKLGYSFFVPQFSKENERGIYTEDALEQLRLQVNNIAKNALENEMISQEDLLIYKLDYIFNNVNNWTTYNGKMQYIENVRYYISVARKILSPEECMRIQAYAITINGDLNNIMSILKIEPLRKIEEQNNNAYYIYSTNDKKYIRKTVEETKQFIERLNNEQLQIIGIADRFDPKEIEELELR